MSDNSEFEVQQVLQISFIANDQKLACILRDLAKVDPKVNYIGYFQVLLKDCCTLVKIVLGKVEDEKYVQNCDDLIAVRNILAKQGVEYNTDNVLNVVPLDTALSQALLSAVDVEVKSSYTTVGGSVIYDVSDLELAKAVLEQPPEGQNQLIQCTLKCDDECRTICSDKCRPNCNKCPKPDDPSCDECKPIKNPCESLFD